MPNQARENLLRLQAMNQGDRGGGLLSGPISRFLTKGSREDKAAELAAANAASEREASGNLITAGFQGADPTVQDLGVSPSEFRAVQGLLANPDTRAQGQEDLQQMAARAGIQEPLGTLDQARLGLIQAQTAGANQSRLGSLAQQGQRDNAAKNVQNQLIFKAEGDLRG